MKDGSVLTPPSRMIEYMYRGIIARVVSKSGYAVAEVWENGAWVPGHPAYVAETLPGRAIELSCKELDAAGIPREDAEEAPTSKLPLPIAE